MKNFLGKLKTNASSPTRSSLKHIMWAWVGSAFAIGLVAYAASFSEMPLIFAPLGASAVLAFAVSSSPLAQPRNIIGGHMFAAFIGIMFYLFFGDAMWVMALAVATAIAIMMLSNTIHPPAGANPLIAISMNANWDFLIQTVLPGSIILTIIAIIYNNLQQDRRYPTYWW